MYKFILILACFFLVSGSSFSNEKMDKLVVNKEYEKIVEKIDKKIEKNWSDYYYLSISHYHLNEINLSYLNSIKSLVTNPYSFNNRFNIETITLVNKKDPEEYRDFLSAAKIKLFLLLAISFMFLFTLLCLKNKKLSRNLSAIQIILIASYVTINNMYITTSPEKLTIQYNETNNQARISPSSQSSLNNNISSQEILFKGRVVEDWVFVKNLAGEPAWIKKTDIAK